MPSSRIKFPLHLTHLNKWSTFKSTPKIELEISVSIDKLFNVFFNLSFRSFKVFISCSIFSYFTLNKD